MRIVGLLSSGSGVGASARLCARELLKAGINVTTCDVSRIFAASHDLDYPRGGERQQGQGSVSVYFLNPPMLLPGLLASGLRQYYGSFNVGYWAWELETLPREWVVATAFVDAILVPSTFCKRAVSRYTEKPVIVVPHPVSKPEAAAAKNARAATGRFRILNVLNFGSSYERKNPRALIRAVRLAFGDDPDVELIIKTGDGARFPDDLARLRREADGVKNVRIIDGMWSEAELSNLYCSADVYASLHRSEGFGLTLAEAIMREVPVVATNWSGSVDICVPHLCYPVDYSLVPFADRHPDYNEVSGARWAEPDLHSAAAQLRAVRADPDQARWRARELKAAFERYVEEVTYDTALRSLVTQRSETCEAERC
ncbi:MAG: glycosyltransferase family 4 protein [Hyphomicrobium sp.]